MSFAWIIEIVANVFRSFHRGNKEIDNPRESSPTVRPQTQRETHIIRYYERAMNAQDERSAEMLAQQEFRYQKREDTLNSRITLLETKVDNQHLECDRRIDAIEKEYERKLQEQNTRHSVDVEKAIGIADQNARTLYELRLEIANLRRQVNQN